MNRYVFSTEGHLLPATPQISLVQEHCAYLGAYCKSDEFKQEAYASDISSEVQETNGSKFSVGRSQTSLPSHFSYVEPIPISGLIKVSVEFSLPAF